MIKGSKYIKNKLIYALQRFVLATAFPPIDKVYRVIYSLVVFTVVRALSGEPAVRAIYLRRGYAKGEWLPGLSDLDFMVVVYDLDDAKRERILEKYSRCSSLTLLPDEILEVRDERTFAEQLEDPLKKYRLVEGKATWKLLYGKDYLSVLPELKLDEITSGLYAEIAVWWAIFSWRLLQVKHNQREPVVCNSICYKAVAEISKAHLALNLSSLTFSRIEALTRVRTHLPRADQQLIEKLELIAGQRFIWRDNLVLGETLRFLLHYIDSLYYSFHNSCILANIKVDCRKDEQLWTDMQYAHVDRVLNYIAERWQDSFCGASLASSYAHELDELILLIRINPQRIPDAKQLYDLYQVHANAVGLRSPVNLYVLYQNTAFQLDATYYTGGWRSILSPLNNADVFHFLALPEFTLQGQLSKPAYKSVWTSVAQEFVRVRHSRLLDSLRSSGQNTLSDLEFLRMFWKFLQLEIINRSANKGQVVFAHSLDAIERTMGSYGSALPVSLRVLKNAFKVGLDGRDCNIKEVIPRAIQYLEELHSQESTWTVRDYEC